MASHHQKGWEGVKLVEDKKYEEGAKVLSEALSGGEAPNWLLARAVAYTHLNQLDEALQDAERAYHVAADRAKRDLMMEAQYRRSVALQKKGLFADADCCAFWALRLSERCSPSEKDDQTSKVDENGEYTEEAAKLPSEPPGTLSDENRKAWNKFNMWRGFCLRFMASIPKGEGHAARKVTVSKVPSKPPAGTAKNKMAVAPAASSNTNDNYRHTEQFNEKVLKNTQYKLSMMETQTGATLCLYVKGADAGKVTAKFEPAKITLTDIPARDGAPPGTYLLYLNNSTDPTKSTIKVTRSTIEIALHKSTARLWKTNAAAVAYQGFAVDQGEQSDSVVSVSEKASSTSKEPGVEQIESEPQDTSESDLTSSAGKGPEITSLATGAERLSEEETKSAGPATISQESAKPAAHSYPTSSKNGPKNWDKFSDDEDGDEKEGINDFFQALYKNSTPEQQRAMMKSFVESNGTQLSTNWDEVKKAPVEISPPEGVEARKWER